MKNAESADEVSKWEHVDASWMSTDAMNSPCPREAIANFADYMSNLEICWGILIQDRTNALRFWYHKQVWMKSTEPVVVLIQQLPGTSGGLGHSANLTVSGQFLVNMKEESSEMVELWTLTLCSFETTDWTHRSGTSVFQKEANRNPPLLEARAPLQCEQVFEEGLVVFLGQFCAKRKELRFWSWSLVSVKVFCV